MSPPKIHGSHTYPSPVYATLFLLSHFDYTLRMLLDTIKNNMKEAMRAKDDIRLQTLRGALAAFTNELVAKGKKPTEELSESDMQVVLKRLAKQRKDSIEQFTKGGRLELAEKETKELAILEAYLPQMASREEILKIAKAKRRRRVWMPPAKASLWGP